MTLRSYLVAGAIAAYALYQLFFADNRDDRPPSPSRSYQPAQPPVHRRDERQLGQRIDSSQRGRIPAKATDYASLRSYQSAQPPVRLRDERQLEQRIDSSQRDHISAEATDYASLRARAKQEGDLMAQCKQQSQEAYERRDHARAKALSDEGKRHASKMKKLNAQACATIFKENNQDGDPCEVDLHGLYVKEAIAYSAKAVTDARRRGDAEIRLIVGQGNHSEGGISKLKPTIQEEMQLCGHHVEVDTKNPGVLLVRLGGR